MGWCRQGGDGSNSGWPGSFGRGHSDEEDSFGTAVHRRPVGPTLALAAAVRLQLRAQRGANAVPASGADAAAGDATAAATTDDSPTVPGRES